MKISRPRTVAAAVLAAGALAAAGPVQSALAFISPPLVLLAAPQSPAALVAKGAAVDVPVTYTCAANFMYIQLTLTEKVGKKIASGNGSTQVTCNGTTQRILVRVNASAGGAAFAKGTAATSTYVTGYIIKNNRFYYGEDTTYGTITLK
jgi:hypothetical protein